MQFKGRHFNQKGKIVIVIDFFMPKKIKHKKNNLFVFMTEYTE